MLEQPPQGLEEQEELPGAGLPLPTTDRGEEGLALLDHWDSLLTKPPQCALAGGSLCPWAGLQTQSPNPIRQPQAPPSATPARRAALLSPCCPWDPWSPLLLIHQCSSRCCRGSWECSSSGQGQKGGPSFSRGLLVILILWCSKGQCRVQWKQRKIWIRNGEQGNGEEQGCELAIRVSVPFLTAISENVTVEAQDTKSCHSLSHSKHLTLLPLGNSLSHWIL